MTFRLRVEEPGRDPHLVEVVGSLVVGRENAELVIFDSSVSRRHLLIETQPDGLVVTDLGSSHGTTIDGVMTTQATLVRPGARIRLGDSVLIVEQSLAARPTVVPQGDHPIDPANAGHPPATDLSTELVSPPGAPGAPVVRSELHRFSAIESEAAVVRFTPGTAAETLAPSYARSLVLARERLRGFGTETAGWRPQVCLVEPFRHPAVPGGVLSEGMLVDAHHGEVWVVVADEVPVESAERVLVSYFAAGLPAAHELSGLIDGYALWLAGATGGDEELARTVLPRLDESEGEVRDAVYVSFVSFLIRRNGEGAFRMLLMSSRPGHVDDAAVSVYSTDLNTLEKEWKEALSTSGAVTTASFLRTSLRYLRPYRLRQAEIFVYMLIGLSFTLAFPFVTQALVDDAIPNGNFGDVIALLAILGSVLAVSLLANLRRNYVSAYVSGSVVRDIRTDMFKRLQSLDTAWYQRYQQGDIMSRLFNDVGQVEQGLSQAIREGTFQLLSLVTAAFVMLKLNLWLGAGVLVAAPLSALAHRFMGTGARDRSVAVQEQTSALFNVAAENYSARSVVKAYSLGDREAERFGVSSETVFGAQRRLVLYTGVFGLSVSLIVTAMRLAVLGVGAWLIIDDQMTIGALVAFLGVMGEVISPVTALTSIAQEIQQSSGALERVNEIIEAEPGMELVTGVDPYPQRIEQGIELRGVEFAYDDDHPVLSDINVVIPAGQRVAFVGPSGSGKSTILRLLMRQYDPVRGGVFVDGVDLRSTDIEAWRSTLGVVFQDSFLFDLSIMENIRLGKLSASDDEVVKAAHDAEMDEFARRLPEGYASSVGEGGSSLSGGQRQRVAIARALLRDPRLLLLDEATSALDPQTERRIVETLQSISAGRTTVAITHRLTSVADYDQIVVLAEGRVVGSGRHEQLLAAGGIYARMWAEQTGDAAMGPSYETTLALARVPQLRGLETSLLEEVATIARTATVPVGERVAEDGYVYVLTGGSANVVEPGLRGAEVVSTTLRTGDVFGLRALVGSTTRAQLEVVETMSAVVLERTLLAALAERQPDLARALDEPLLSAIPAAGGSVKRRSLVLSVSRPAANDEAPINAR